MRRTALLAALLACLGGPGLSRGAVADEPAPGAPAAEPAEWTILVYHDADCDLEAPMLDDLDEMLAVGSTPAVRIAAFVDRSPAGEPEGRYANRQVGGLEDWAGAKYVEVGRGALHELGTPEGEPNMGDPATLLAFVEQGMKDFPAKHTALLLSDHGLAWPGVCSDDSHDHDFLDLGEIRAVLAKVAATHGKLALLGFDACLMATVEVAAAVAPFADVLVASEELEPGTGWWYTPVLEALSQAPTTDAATLGAWIADHYAASFSRQKESADAGAGRTITLSVIDLAKAGAVAAAAGALAGAATKALAAKGREAWVPIARARARAEEYGRSADPGNAGSEMFDLGDLADLLARAHPGLAPAAAKVKAALDAAVLHAVRGDTRPASHGLSVYFPREPGDLRPAYETLTAGSSKEWIALLDAFGALATADTAKPDAADAAASAATLAPDEKITVSTQIASLDDLERVSFVLAEAHGDATLVVGAIPDEPAEDGKLATVWDGRWFTLEDGKQRLLCPISSVDEVDDEDDTYVAEVPAQVQTQGKGPWRDVTLSFYLDVDEDGVAGAFLTATAYEPGGPREVPLEKGDKVRAVYLRVEASGEVVPVASDGADAVLTVDDEDEFRVGFDRVPPGDWRVGFWIEDLAGNSTLELTPVGVK